MQKQIKNFKEKLAVNTAANLARRKSAWDKRDAYFNAKDKLVSELKSKGYKHTHGNCVICQAIEQLSKDYEN